MIRGSSSVLYLLLFLSFLQSILAFNSSLLNNTNILQDVLKQISAKQRWDLKSVKVSKLNSGKVRFGSSQRYEFRIGHVVVLFSDDVVSWRKFKRPKTHFGCLVKDLTSMAAAIDRFKMVGSFELIVGGNHHLSLSLLLQIERDFRRRGILQQDFAGWWTRSAVERVWFEVLARVEVERLRLRPILVKKIRPFIIADSSECDNPTNTSFTNSQSILVAPEALTLDVKW